jgi:hypothetical protein
MRIFSGLKYVYGRVVGRSPFYAALVMAFACLFASGSAFSDDAVGKSSAEEKQLPPRLEELPFVSGEKIFYVIRWGIFDVGSATLEVTGPVIREGQKAWQIVLTAQTNSFADKIFKVRDYNAVWVDENFTKPLYYVKNQNEGSTHREVVVTFDWEKNKAQYSDKGVAHNPIDILPGSWDPLAITYAVRAMDLSSATHISVPSTDGKKSTTTEINIGTPEIIRTPAGRFETIMLLPDTKDLGGVFRKSSDASIRLWFSNDNRHIPIRMASKVIVGSFVAEMVRVEGPGGEIYNKKDDKPQAPQPPRRGGRKAQASSTGASSDE